MLEGRYLPRRGRCISPHLGLAGAHCGLAAHCAYDQTNSINVAGDKGRQEGRGERLSLLLREKIIPSPCLEDYSPVTWT